MSEYLDPISEELLKDFFAEAELQVEALESNILALESSPDDSDAVDEVFRAAHTLKGSSAAVRMNELSGFTHVVEDALDAVRCGKAAVTAESVDALLQSVDVIKRMLHARGSGAEYQQSTEQLCRRLRGLPGESSSEVTPAAQYSAGGRIPDSPAGQPLSESDFLELQQAAADGETVYRVVVSFNADGPMNTVGGVQVFAALRKKARVLRTEPEFEVLYEDLFLPVVEFFVATCEEPAVVAQTASIADVTTGVDVKRLDQMSHSPHRTAPAVVPEPAEPAAVETVGRDQRPDDPGRSGESGPAATVLRVESRRIDGLLKLVSEAVINKAGLNQLVDEFEAVVNRYEHADQECRDQLKALFEALPGYLQQMQQGASALEVRGQLVNRFAVLYGMHDQFENQLRSAVAKFSSRAQDLGRITAQLQQGIIGIRMVPIARLFSRFPRLLRDLSRSLDKRIRLETEGEKTELDRAVIEDLIDPLVHCVRNSVDHGLESPSERRQAGKSEQGCVKLKAAYEGSMIVIEVSDDGRGIDVEKVRARAVERGIMRAEERITDSEAFNLIFEPGFSTAERVTPVSGRGVGLDVVRRQIEKLNGTVSVRSELGGGASIVIRIPVTVAIMSGLLVRVGKEVYAIPVAAVIASYRIGPDEIKLTDDREFFQVRNYFVPLLRLNRLFHLQTDERKDYQCVVIVRSREEKLGLVVDSVIGEQDVVMQPLRDHYTSAPGIAGASIIGDGTVCLIIDVPQLLELEPGLKYELEQRPRRETTIG
ncbi:MAG: chemotaxis protein CheA [Spirochaetaceae bacterium]|nr:MAG: chemotaxis protein CheA [Spirochaetaceae bacterium]